MKMPGSWGRVIANSIEASDKPQTKVEATLDMSDEVAGQGICPECKKPMERAVLNDNQVWVCMDDRITLPIKDESAET